MIRRAISLLVLAGAARPPAGCAAQVGATARDTAVAVRVTGYLQPRLQAIGDTTAFFLRRARVAVEGQITAWASFRAQVEMRTIGAAATPAASPLTLSATDLFVRLSSGRWGGTVGQFRVPFSLESLLSSTILETTERSRVVNAAKRDIGAQADWHLSNRFLVQAAVVNGEGPNRASNPDNRMAYFIRAVLTPLHGLDVGGAFEDYADSSGADVETMYQGGRWRARAEYVRTRGRVTGVQSRGWYALAAFLVLPRRLQLVGRVEQYDPSQQAGADRVTGYSIGAQYFIRGDNLKVLADYEEFREQTAQLKNDRVVVQLQARFQ